jgi:VPDSG-CTERM motif
MKALPKLLMLLAAVAMLAFSHNASAVIQPQPIVSVPDGGTTVMLLGAALGALGMARRFLKI